MLAHNRPPIAAGRPQIWLELPQPDTGLLCCSKRSENEGSPEVRDGEVLFELAVTKASLRQVIVGLTLICRSSYRGVVEFVRDLLSVPVSLGCVHDVLQAATRQAGVINREQDLSGIRVGLHDEIFQGATPVLAGVDAQSTYCYLLAAEDHRDADTWGVHLLDATEQGLRPDYTIADAGQGLRAGQRAAWGDTPCHGDVFHIQRQCEGLANTLSHLATGATSRRKTLQARIDRAGQNGPDNELAAQLRLARQSQAQANWLARDVRTLVQWLRYDVLALAGPDLATWRELFDFIVAELAAGDPEDTRALCRWTERKHRRDVAGIGRLQQHASELLVYLERSEDALVPYAARRRRGEPISTAFVESAVGEIVAKRMNKKQQIRWNRTTVQSFLDVRTAVLNDTLEAAFRHRHPGFRPANDDQRATTAAA